jgi:hypothetical protein
MTVSSHVPFFAGFISSPSTVRRLKSSALSVILAHVRPEIGSLSRVNRPSAR